MCTILTFDIDLYTAEGSAILSQIATDTKYNDDGFSALIMGQDPEDSFFIKSMNAKSFLIQLESILNSELWERCWVHTRAATTGFTSINECHGFSADRYMVFHNGTILDKAADDYRVDSWFIAEYLANYDLGPTLGWLKLEPFANVMIVDVTSGAYFVSRSRAGQLHTDNKGNFSTNRIPVVMEMSVDTYETFKYKEGFVYKPVYTHQSKASKVMSNIGKVDEYSDSTEDILYKLEEMDEMDAKLESWDSVTRNKKAK